MKKLAILGASGHGKVVADTAECCDWESVNFFDDAWPSLQKNSKWPVVGDTAALIANLDRFDGVVVAIGDNHIRYRKLQELKSAGARLVTLIHPSAIISRYTEIGDATVIFAGVVVNADTRLGMGVILNTACSVDHDCSLGDAVHISPGARLGGAVKVGELTWLGIGSTVRQQVNISSRVVVGAGAVVVEDIPNDITVVGVPAKKIGNKNA